MARHTFPLDGQYVLKASLLQTNLGAVRGLLEPHDIEFSIDGRRVFLATAGGNEDNARSAANTADIIAALDTRLTTRVTVTAGPHVVGASFLSRTAAQGGSKLQPFLRTTLDAGDHSGLPHVASLTITGPFDATGPGDTPSRQRIFSCRPRAAADESRCAHDSLRACPPRLPAPGDERRDRSSAHAVSRRAGAGVLRYRHRVRAAGHSGQSQVRVSRRGEIAELASRLSFFLWSSIPDDELLNAGGAEPAAQPGGARAQQVRRMLADPRSEALVEQLRRPVAAAAEPASSRPNPDLPGLRRQPAAGVPARDGAVLREHHARRPQRARSADRRLHVRERAAGQALRHSRTSTAASSGA